MQGMMGAYLEKNVQTFMETQQRLQDQSRTLYGDNPILNADTWAQFLKFQGPAMQGLLGSYLEQSANMFLDMQSQLQKQTRSLFGNFGFPDFGATPQTASSQQAAPKSEMPDADSGKPAEDKKSP